MLNLNLARRYEAEAIDPAVLNAALEAEKTDFGILLDEQHWPARPVLAEQLAELERAATSQEGRTLIALLRKRAA